MSIFFKKTTQLCYRYLEEETQLLYVWTVFHFPPFDMRFFFEARVLVVLFQVLYETKCVLGINVIK